MGEHIDSVISSIREAYALTPKEYRVHQLEPSSISKYGHGVCKEIRYGFLTFPTGDDDDEPYTQPVYTVLNYFDEPIAQCPVAAVIVEYFAKERSNVYEGPIN